MRAGVSARAKQASGAEPVSGATRGEPRSKTAPSPAATGTSVPVVEAILDTPARPHKYRVGETVYYTSPTFGRAAASGRYTIVKLLPSESDDYQYRIKSTNEAFERVARESQLDKA